MVRHHMYMVQHHIYIMGPPLEQYIYGDEPYVYSCNHIYKAKHQHMVVYIYNVM